ncbi:hypothetical protein B0H10DRAFT_2443036 [Mycena sp. CBHHK59/15]|nr:hypothetical protein B0H10DRAFT_2443036 [Mycena sp. CBHHK59/15]
MPSSRNPRASSPSPTITPPRRRHSSTARHSSRSRSPTRRQPSSRTAMRDCSSSGSPTRRSSSGSPRRHSSSSARDAGHDDNIDYKAAYNALRVTHAAQKKRKRTEMSTSTQALVVEFASWPHCSARCPPLSRTPRPMSLTHIQTTTTSTSYPLTLPKQS